MTWRRRSASPVTVTAAGASSASGRAGSIACAASTASPASAVRSTGRGLERAALVEPREQQQVARRAGPCAASRAGCRSSSARDRPGGRARRGRRAPRRRSRPRPGVRSSCEASEMKRRRRASEAERSAKASSIWPSIALSAPPRRPISVVPPSGSTRRERSPAPIAAAVSSMRRSGRRLARDQPEPEQEHAGDHGAGHEQLDPAELVERRVGVLVSGAPRISVVVRERRLLREQAEARRRRSSAPTVARRGRRRRRSEAASGCAASGRRLPGGRSCRCRAGRRRWRISTYMPGWQHCRGAARPSSWPGPGPAGRATARRRSRCCRASGRRGRRATSAARCRSRRRPPAGRPPTSTTSTSEQARAQRHLAHRRPDAPAAAAADRH